MVYHLNHENGLQKMLGISMCDKRDNPWYKHLHCQYVPGDVGIGYDHRQFILAIYVHGDSPKNIPHSILYGVYIYIYIYVHITKAGSQL